MRKVFEKPCQTWLCEKYSRQILKLKETNNLSSLPLTPEISKQIYENWDRTDLTEFYQKLKEL